MPQTTVRVENPDIQKTVKVQKRGAIHLSRDLAGERVEIIAKTVDETPDPDAQAVDSAISSFMAALDADDEDARMNALRQALVALDREAE